MKDEQYIVHGDPVDPKLNTITERSLGEFYLKKLKQLNETVVFINAHTSEQLTAAKLRSSSIRVAECLRAIGVKPGETVGLCTENRFEFLYVLFGTIYLGATVAAFNVTYTESELDHAVGLAKPKVIFASSIAMDTVRKIMKKNMFVQKGIVLDNVGVQWQTNCREKSYLDFTGNPFVQSSKKFTCAKQNIAENVALTLFSSGTTGLSKGVQFTQKNIFFLNIRFIYDGLESRKSGIDTILFLPLPWFHAYACIYLFGIVFNFSRTVFLPKYESRSFLKAIQNYKVTRAFVAPPVLVYLVKTPLLAQYNLSSLRVIGVGAATTSKELCRTIEKLLPSVRICNAYGMTEMMSLAGQNSRFNKIGSVGGLRHGISGKVIDVETGTVLGRNHAGELLFKGDNLMKGYVDNVRETNQFIDKDGWGHTGDVGYFDDDGELFVVDRLKELIKYKGFQVPPAEIEALLLSHPGVRDVAVVGVPDDRAGEVPMAFVALQSGTVVTEKELMDFVAENISPSKRLYGGVRFIDEIPKNVTGKILRKDLRKMTLHENKLQSKL